MTDVGFAQAYSFKYSPRPGTPAAAAPQCPEALKAERLAMLQQLLDAQQLSFNRATVGRRLAVLLDRPGRRPGQLVGRSPYMQAVHVDAPEALAGAIVSVRIDAAHPNSLSGQLEPGDYAPETGPMAACPGTEDPISWAEARA